jgi:mutual gliding-motility protein MglA
MVAIDFPRRQVTLKVVYYGPALSGKTTNLRELHRLFAAGSKGRLMTLDTVGDRTLFFEMLPLAFRASDRLSLAVKLYTVPGQVLHNATRRHVLAGADGVVFVADSRPSERAACEESLENLRFNLSEDGVELAQFPLVVQYNKRDLPGALGDEALRAEEQRRGCPIFSAVALRGEGVVETFFGLLNSIWDSLERRFSFSKKFSVTREEFLGSLQHHLDTDPIKSSGRYRAITDEDPDRGSGGRGPGSK